MRLADLLRAALLAALVAVLWAHAYDRLDSGRWSEPLSYSGDAWAFHASLKAATDGHVKPLAEIHVPELNAPFGASWNDYPNRQPTLLWLAAFPARWLGLFATVSLMLLLAHVGAALSFYGVARYFHARWEWAMAGAFTYAFSPYLFLRADRQLALSLYAHLPLLGLVLSWAYARRGPGLRAGRRMPVAIGAAVVAGIGNIYYAALFLQLLLLAALAQALRRRGTWAFGAPLFLAAVVAVFVLGENLHYIRYQRSHGPNPAAVTRSYGDVERFALKPIDLLLPLPGHGLGEWGTRVRGYWLGSVVPGEKGSAYLGLVGIAALLSLLIRPVTAVLRGRPVVVTGAVGAVLWILAYAVVGGIGGLVSLIGPIWLRGTNRFSIWILTVVLLVACLRLSRAPFSRRRAASLAAAVAAAVLAWSDQATVEQRPKDIGSSGEAAGDRAFVQKMEASLPAGAMLFQLPVLAYPEATPPGRMLHYEPFRPYFFSTRLRFSYGTDRGRPREAWQQRVAGLPPEAMAATLETYGFAGILLNRRGYPDEGTSLLRDLADAGRPATIAGEGNDLVLVPLRPRKDPERPGVPVLLGAGWEEGSDAEGGGGCWSTGDAEWIVTNERGSPSILHLSFELASLRPRQVTVRQGRRVLGSWQVAAPLAVRGLRVDVPRWESRIVFETDRPADEAQEGDGRPLAFRIARLEAEWERQ